MPPTSSKTYDYRITFDAPRPFVFRWCTDYQPTDARLERESYTRKVVERSKRRIVYEDLVDTPKGWYWARHVVTLNGPAHWHSDSFGSHRVFRLDYNLKTLRDGKTEMRFRGRRTPVGVASANPTTASFTKGMDRTWIQFRRALERDYRSTQRGKARGRGKGRS